MEVFIKDENTGKDRYFIYIRKNNGWTTFTGLRYSSYIRAEEVAKAIREA